MRNPFKYRNLVTFAFITILYVPSLFAFVVRSEYQSKGPYGNAETVPFHWALTGTTPLTPEEEATLVQELPQSELQRFYGRVSLDFGQRSLNQIRNKSLSSSVYASGAVVANRFTENQTGLELAIGYGWERDFRVELEYLTNKTFNISATPILNTLPATTLTASIKNNTLLLNVYFDFLGFDRFRPYVVGGVGGAANAVSTMLIPPPVDGGSLNRKLTSWAWNVGVGFRVSVLSRWFVDVKYRYTHLGVVKLTPNNNFRLNTNYEISAIGVGLIYIF